MKLDWSPKAYSAGAIDGAGLRRLLGASHHDPLTLLVRETIQNSWDASIDSDGNPRGGQPSWHLELREVDSSLLRESFERTDVPGTRIAEMLSGSTTRVIEVSDRGTSGLGGPIRNDLAFSPEVSTDFIDLILNIGAPQDTQGGGGTYGFGKIAAFGVSECATVLYRSVPLDGVEGAEAMSERLIGSTIGENFDLDGVRYTGRHWWGIHHPNRPEPLVGDHAASISNRLFTHPFRHGEGGTSLLIIAPKLNGLTPHEAMDRVVDAVLWNAWPKLVPRTPGGSPPLSISLSLDGAPVPIPAPASTRPFAGFVDALLNVRARDAGRSTDDIQRSEHCLHVSEHEFASERPAQLVGHVAIARVAPPDLPEAGGEPEDHGVAHFSGPAHHLALMRQPELIVNYVEGPPMPATGVEWCGVFKVAEDIDGYFAEAEPPSHDDWLVGRVEHRHGRVFVRRGREKGPRELFRELFVPTEPPEDEYMPRPLAHLANDLGHLVEFGSARGGTTQERPPGPASTRRLEIRASRPFARDGRFGVVVEASVLVGGLLTASASVALAGGGSDRSEDLAAIAPTVVGVTPINGSIDQAYSLPREVPPGVYEIWVDNPGGVTVAADIRLQPGGD